MRSLRVSVSLAATAVITVPVAAVTVLAVMSARNEAMRPDTSPVEMRYLCSFAVVPPRSDLLPGDVSNVVVGWAETQHCVRNRNADSTEVEWFNQVPSKPVRVGDITFDDTIDADTIITCGADYSSAVVIPELSLWPFTDATKIRYKYVADNGYTRTVPPEDVPLRPDDRARLQQAQRALNTRVLLLTFGAVLLSTLFGCVVWLATSRMLRPVEAIRREMADITEHDLTRRVPVSRNRNEIAELADTVNATLDRLETAVQDNRRFVADASHELRSPIAALRAELEIATTHPSQADWPAVVDAALADTERLQHLASDLLLLARLDHDSTATATASRIAGDDVLDLTALIRDQTNIRRSRHTLTTDLPDHPVSARGRRALLDRLLGNLLDNAERHATTTITVRLSTANDQAILEVLDDGPGIPPDDHERVFDRFTRLDDARTRDTGGTGLGLPIARRIATNHAGTLQAVDPDVGGARFVVTLPLTP
ncbi:HAMP domain-containing histidine kinase [Saccharothrix syringae]|uniref:histidine kinase n=2 Tax=Saccharothrix syringae TaxID=103733 RepID=A0A5Q0HEV9_SACSY|nr:HAMP domain-containing histidine kinase [Saccharothrix syringae]